ncbi:tRNA(Ile)-lysidine synthase [Leucobacter soli]|uniref:tRNA(Ile)-lysidine synthase n=1 Tax=Leucobacter soli TaxID=2812850 RepID=A0A916K2G9_9MICO|nr:tRNA lysidine(34) synthetase TilS [Leucobacter soli]CAG7620459.1 tRNA(Ile)-lysidine synthase [Leucobacter soli]
MLVALSGGADSLALAAAVAFEAPRAGMRAGAVVVDHGLQEGSAGVAERAAEQARGLGLDPVLVRRVVVAARRSGGPEAAARTARYAALEEARAELGAAAILTAHTRDDQAEQVLLGLARGSGSRAISGIPPMRGAILRPFLGLSRATTERACAAQALEPWRDPHNADRSYARVRVRSSIMPALERELGPGVAANLARSAELAREDADALDALAAQLHARAVRPGDGRVELDVAVLAAAAPALRNRVIRRAASEGFGAQLNREHTLAVAALVVDWRGQGPIDVPGVWAVRVADRVMLVARDRDRDRGPGARAGAGPGAGSDAGAEPGPTEGPSEERRTT